jgi:hypothetical protein
MEDAERLFIEDFNTWDMTGYYLYSKLLRSGVSRHIDTGGYGYRRIQVFLARRGHEMGPERAHRLWRQAGGSKYRENGPGGV